MCLVYFFKVKVILSCIEEIAASIQKMKKEARWLIHGRVNTSTNLSKVTEETGKKHSVAPTFVGGVKIRGHDVCGQQQNAAVPHTVESEHN